MTLFYKLHLRTIKRNNREGGINKLIVKSLFFLGKKIKC